MFSLFIKVIYSFRNVKKLLKEINEEEADLSRIDSYYKSIHEWLFLIPPENFPY